MRKAMSMRELVNALKDVATKHNVVIVTQRAANPNADPPEVHVPWLVIRSVGSVEEFVADDGSVMDEPVRLKIPGMIERLMQRAISAEHNFTVQLDETRLLLGAGHGQYQCSGCGAVGPNGQDNQRWAGGPVSGGGFTVTHWCPADSPPGQLFASGWTHAVPVLSPSTIDWRVECVRLWGLLDDIDTLSDATKGNYDAFYRHSMKRVAARHEVLRSDGYRLYAPDEWHKITDPPTVDPLFDGDRPAMKFNASPAKSGNELSQKRCGPRLSDADATKLREFCDQPGSRPVDVVGDSPNDGEG